MNEAVSLNPTQFPILISKTQHALIERARPFPDSTLIFVLVALDSGINIGLRLLTLVKF